MALEAEYLGQCTEVVPYTPSGAVAAGEVVILANNCHVASRAIAASGLGSLYCNGLFKSAYNSSAGAVTDGAKIYFNTTSNECTDSTSGTTLIGRCVGSTTGASGATVTYRLINPGA